MIVAVVLLLTGAKVFATVNSESQFGLWYAGKFQAVDNSISERTETDSVVMQESITKYVDEMFGEIKELLDPTSAIKTAEIRIHNQKDHYKAKLDEAKESLNTDYFRTFEDEQKEKIKVEIEQDIEEFLEDYLSK